MSKSRKAVFGTIGIMMGGLAFTQAGASNTLTPAEKKAGWVLLFDGKDKDSNWRHNETGNTPSKWTLEDSSMRTVNEYSFLCTKDQPALQFSNFEWQVDWKLAKSANSGLFIRVVTSTYNDGYEYGILDDQFGGDRNELSKNPEDKLPSGKMPPIKRSGGIYDLYPTTKDGQIGGQYYDSTAAKPYGQWNHGVVWAEGDHIEHWLNGRKVVVAEIGSAEWVARFKNSKWNVPSLSVDKWAHNPKGSLCMQAHGGGDEGLAWFKNIKVRPFTPGETLVAPSIGPEGGSFSSGMKVGLEAAITGAIIHYTLDGSEPTETSPVYQDSLSLTATTTVKAKTFRARFKASATASAVFTKTTSSIGKRDLSPVPSVSFSSEADGFSIHNGNASVFEGTVYDIFGKPVHSFSMGENETNLLVTGMHRGVYFVKVQRGGWNRLHKVLVD
jgi:hypothetical protein